MIYKKLLKNIENKSITVERINTQPPLEYNNDILSINENVLNQWNNYQNDIANLTAQNTQQQKQIDTIKTDQGDLGDQVQGIQGQVNINVNDISSIKTKDNQQDIQIQKNSQDITQLINSLKELKLLVYKGQYQTGTTYKLGEIVSFEGKNYLCKVESTTNDPTNTNDWDLWSSEEIDLSNYVTTPQLNDKLNGYTTIDQFNDLEMDFGSRIANLESQITELTKLVQKQQEQISALQTLTQEQQTYINQLKTRILIKSDSTNLVAPNGTSQISISNTNAFKNITGNWETLSSESWINDELSNYTRTLRIRELRVGSSKSNTAWIRIYQYSDEQMIISFKGGYVHNIIAPNDKRIKWDGGAWYFT